MLIVTGESDGIYYITEFSGITELKVGVIQIYGMAWYSKMQFNY